MVDSNTDNSREEPTPIPKPHENSDEFIQMGVETDFPVSTWSSFSFGQEFKGGEGKFILGKSNYAVPLDKLREMRRRDAQTRSLLRLFWMPIVSCLQEGKWVKAPWVEDGDDEVDFANAMFRTPMQAGGMSTPLSLVLKQTLLAVVEGFAAFEEVRKVPKEGPLKGKWVLDGLEYRDSRTVDIIVDRFGKFNGIRQQARRPDGTLLDVEIPKDKCLLFTVGAEENPYVGVSMFESAWYHYDTKVKLYYVAHKAAQFAAVPGRIGKYPQTATNAKKRQFASALRDFANNASIMVPEGYEVSPFMTNSGFNFVELIDHHSHLQAKSVLLQFMDNDNRLAIIDNGGQDASADMFVQGLMSIMNDIAELWTNQLMPKYIDWNFGSGKYPQWKFGELTDSARSAIETMFTSMVNSPTLNSTPELFRALEKALAGRLGLDIDYKAIEEREAKAAKRAADLAKAEADALAAQQEAKQLENGMLDAASSKGAAAGQPEAIQPGADPNAQSAPGIGSTAPVAPTTPTGDPSQTPAMSADYQDELDYLVELAQGLMEDSPIYDVDDLEFDFYGPSFDESSSEVSLSDVSDEESEDSFDTDYDYGEYDDDEDYGEYSSGDDEEED